MHARHKNYEGVYVSYLCIRKKATGTVSKNRNQWNVNNSITGGITAIIISGSTH